MAKLTKFIGAHPKPDPLCLMLGALNLVNLTRLKGAPTRVGYEPSVKMRGMIGRLLLAARRGGEVVYVGGVGTGFTHRELIDLKKRLDALRTTTQPVKLKRKGAVFVDPQLIAEIEFRAWTDDQKLRHGSFKGLREGADSSEVMKLE